MREVWSILKPAILTTLVGVPIIALILGLAAIWKALV